MTNLTWDPLEFKQSWKLKRGYILYICTAFCKHPLLLKNPKNNFECSYRGFEKMKNDIDELFLLFGITSSYLNIYINKSIFSPDF